MSSLLIQADLLPLFPDFLLHRSWDRKKCRLNAAQLSQAPLPSSTLAHEIPPSRPQETSKLSHQKSRVTILLFALLLLLKILNSTITRSLHPKLPPAFTSLTSPFLLVRTRVRSTPRLVGSSTTYVRKLSSTRVPGHVFSSTDAWMIKVPHVNQCPGLRGYFQLPVEDLTNFIFLIWWPIVRPPQQCHPYQPAP